MTNKTANSSWPENCRRPAPDTQPWLFREPVDKILSELGISGDDLLRWRTLGWTEIDGQ